MLSLLMFTRTPGLSNPCPAEELMQIAIEQPQHYAQVFEVTRAAFAGDDEAHLVERLRADGLVRLSLVAVEDGEVVGHVLFTDLAVTVDARAVRALCLAPVSVRPDYQNSGVGSMLIREGLRQSAQAGFEAVVVLGHPAYYPRFGFSAKLAEKLVAPFAGEAFMAIELLDGALQGEAGTVVYPEAFGIVEGH